MAEHPHIKVHHGDVVEFDCLCGEGMTLVWNGTDDDTCENCGRRWRMRNQVILVEKASVHRSPRDGDG